MSSGSPIYSIEHGDVWWGSASDANPILGSGKRHVCDGTGQLALCFDSEGVLYKHGEAGAVEGWAEKTRQKSLAGPAPDLMPRLTVVSFLVSPETVDELNACVATTGRVLNIEQRLMEIGAQRPDLYTRPRYPA